MASRLALDIGTTSIGWILYKLSGGHPSQIVDLGVRIFSSGRDAKHNRPLGGDRTLARGARRNLARFKMRKKALMNYLMKHGFMPNNSFEAKMLEKLDPYYLRAMAIKEQMPLYHIGRALFHINQRRGFKSNRKADKAVKDNDGVKIRDGANRLREAMEKDEASTLGEFLFNRRNSSFDQNSIPSVRTRLSTVNGKNNNYEYYATRDMLEDEFYQILNKQKKFYPDNITNETIDALYNVIFFQRPLKEVKVGLCSFIPEEERLPKSHPLFQKRKLLEDINHLKIIEKFKPVALSIEQRNIIFNHLRSHKSCTFNAIRKMLNINNSFNKETSKNKDMSGDIVYAAMSNDEYFGQLWSDLSDNDQCDIIEKIDNIESDEDANKIISFLQEKFGFSHEKCVNICNAKLPSGHGRIGITATKKIIYELEKNVIPYSDATRNAGLVLNRNTDEYDALPYYGHILEHYITPGTSSPKDPEEMRIGRIGNPTVHIALNQLRNLVNKIIEKYGCPDEIIVEMGRELKMTDKQKEEYEKSTKKNEEKNKKIIDELKNFNVEINRKNIEKYKLWEELSEDQDRRFCIYTGTIISLADIYNGNTDVDHILPLSKTLDDSMGNKTICFAVANRKKKNFSPYDAFGHTDEWKNIQKRAEEAFEKKHKGKYSRFSDSAMEDFINNGGFEARHLTNMQYITRVSVEYLSCLYPSQGEGSCRVWSTSGRLTEIVRRKLGLNSILDIAGKDGIFIKNRFDHRHHIVDAACIGLMDRPFLQKVSRESGLKGQEGRERIIVTEPWDNFRNELSHRISKVYVSHRLDQKSKSVAGKTTGRLHAETAYGIANKGSDDNVVVYRKEIINLSLGDIENIRDARLQGAIKSFVGDSQKKALKEKLAQFGNEYTFNKNGNIIYPYKGIRSVRLTKIENNLISVKNKDGDVIKYYTPDGNESIVAWRVPDSKKWVEEVVTVYDSNNKYYISPVKIKFPTAKKMLTIYKSDCIAFEENETRIILKVQKISKGMIGLVALHEGGGIESRTQDKSDYLKYNFKSISSLEKLNVRKVHVDILGHLIDPGPIGK